MPDWLLLVEHIQNIGQNQTTYKSAHNDIADIFDSQSIFSSCLHHRDIVEFIHCKHSMYPKKKKSCFSFQFRFILLYMLLHHSIFLTHRSFKMHQMRGEHGQKTYSNKIIRFNNLNLISVHCSLSVNLFSLVG